MTTAIILTWLIRVIRWAIVFFFGIFLYRKFKLPSLPWIAAYSLAKIVPGIFVPFLMGVLLKKGFEPLFGENLYKTLFAHFDAHPEGYKLAAGIFKWQDLFGGISYLLLTLLVISEVIYIISTNTQITIPRELKYTLWIRDRVKFVGISIVAIALFSPIVTLLAVNIMSN